MTDTYDRDEKEILESFERGEWVSVKNVTDEKARYQKAAQASIKKDKHVKIRLGYGIEPRYDQKPARRLDCPL